MKLSIHKLEEHVGAVVEGVDVTAPIAPETIRRLRIALPQHGVLLFRGQAIDDDQLVALTRAFGRLERTMVHDPIGHGGPVGVISNVDEHGKIIPRDDARILYTIGNTLWHSDGSFKRVPLRGSLLAAKVVPPEGGETEFAGLCAAYAALPTSKKSALEGLTAEHSLAHSRALIAPDLMSDAFLRETAPARQPLVRTISETGHKALLVGSYASHILELPLEEGKALLEELLSWCTQARFLYRHAWQTNDLLVYDNRCCLHRGRPWDRGRYKRILHRTTLAGEDAA